MITPPLNLSGAPTVQVNIKLLNFIVIIISQIFAGFTSIVMINYASESPIAISDFSLRVQTVQVCRH